MTTQTMGPRDFGYIVSEVGTISRESGTVAAGQDLKAGSVIALDNESKIIAHDGVLDTAGEVVVTPVLGVMMVNVDATTEGAGGDVVGVPYTARLTEVRDTDLIYPADDTAGSVRTAIIKDFERNHIVVR